MRLRASSTGPDETEALAAALAGCLDDHVVIGLIGGLGAGKTCFVRGLAAGLGIDPDDVASPTFVYLVDYSAGDGRTLYHADLYRLAELPPEHAGQVFEGIGLTAAVEGGGPDAARAVTAVEWWEYYRGPSPEDLVTVEFSMEKADHRSILLEFAGSRLLRAAHELAGHANVSLTTVTASS